MTIKFTEKVFQNRYNDDFSDSAGYQRILFSPRKALQARELTQLQTIIQEQMARFGRNIFKEGAAVVPGGLFVNDAFEFIKVQEATLPTFTSGEKLLGQTSGIEVELISTEAAASGDPATLYVRYTDSLQGTSGTESIRVTAGETLVGQESGSTVTVQSVDTSVNPATGLGVKVSTNEGSFFTQGFFVYAPAQTLVISKYSRDVTINVGFKVVQEIVTADDDDTLFDNTGAVPNITAPGADRFRIKLVLTTEDLIQSDETFVHIGKIVNSQIVTTATGFNQYNKINDLLAQRTKEESGDYIVNPFELSFDSESPTELKATIGDGVAYVNGYRAFTPTAEFITIDRSQTTETINNVSTATSFGDFVILESLENTPDISTFEKVNIASDSSGTGVIGETRIRSIDKVGDGTFRAYLFDTELSGSNQFRTARALADSDTGFVGVIRREAGIATRKEVSNAPLLFPLSEKRPQELSDITLQVQRRFTGTTDGSGELIISLSDVNETFSNTSDWVVTDGGTVVASPSISGSGSAQATITGLTATSAVQILAYVNKSAATAKTKSETTNTATVTLTTVDGIAQASVGYADIIDFEYIRSDSDDGPDISHKFITDNGQRDTHYEHGKIRLKAGQSHTGSVFLKVKHYNHSTSGDFYCVNSYSGTNYAKIPSHTMKNGQTVQLRDVLDFRPVADAAGNFSTSTARIAELPKNTDVVQSDIEFYHSRYDKIVIAENGDIQHIKGIPALSPKFAPTPENTLELYRIKLNPYTLSPSDLSTKLIETKGFTMAAISRLEERVERLEEMTALSLLELDTSNLEVLDSDGNDRTKSGFLVDNFKDQYHSDVNYSEYKASIDPREYTLHPAFNQDNVGLVYDSDLSTNTVIKGDNVYLKYENEVWFEQDQASRTENVNPFAAFQFSGNVTLSPASDEWKDTKRLANKVISGGTLINGVQSTQWNGWGWGWSGADVNGLEVGDEAEVAGTRESTTRAFTERTGDWTIRGNNVTTTAVVSRVISSETIRKVVADRIVDVAVIPWIRSRKVFFKANGVRPNVEIFPYFDGEEVSDWVKQESFQNFGANKTEYGNTQNRATQHPDGKSALYSDSKGRVSGSFFIPNTDQRKFRCGTREFALLDVTAYNKENSSTIAVTNYEAKGVLETKQRTVKSTRSVQISNSRKTVDTDRIVTSRTQREEPQRDPIAQSFFVDNEEGMFLTKARVYFKTKAETLPVEIQIRPMVNGYPSSDVIIPGSIVSKDPSDVSISDNATAGTDFEFEEPIFLDSFTEYAIIVICDTTEYEAWTSFMGDFVLGSTEKRIVKQPTLSSFFKSQNASTWEPAQWQDLKLVLYRAKFSGTSATVKLKNNTIPQELLESNPIETTSGSSYVVVYQENHGLQIGDSVTISGCSSVGGLTINGSHTVANFNDKVETDRYYINIGSNATSTETGGGDSVLATKNIPFDVIVPQIQKLLPRKTNLNLKGKFTSGKSPAGSQTAYLQDTSFSDLTILENNYFEAPRLVTTSAKETALGHSSIDMEASLETTSDWVSPVVDLQRTSAVLIGNRLENQASAAEVGKNVPIKYVAETDNSEGSNPSKHITKPVTLVSDAVGLKVILAANRPAGSDIQVYYRTATLAEDIYEKDYEEASKEINVASDENRSIFREYRYTIGGDGGSLAPFDIFQVKLVFTSQNTSKAPTVKDLRIIALGV